MAADTLRPKALQELRGTLTRLQKGQAGEGHWVFARWRWNVARRASLEGRRQEKQTWTPLLTSPLNMAWCVIASRPLQGTEQGWIHTYAVMRLY